MLDITDEDHKRRTARANEREIKKKSDYIAEPHRSSLCETIRRAGCPVKIKLAAFLAAPRYSITTRSGIKTPKVMTSHFYNRVRLFNR
jgi:hypothetical protein